MKRNLTLAAVFIFPGVLPQGNAEEKTQRSLHTAAYQNSVSQEQLRLETRRQEMEMLELLGQLGQYSFTQAEHGVLKEVLGQIDQVAENKMPDVVRLLRDAGRQSQADQARSRLVSASGGQKEIQAELRALADRLLLKQDEAALRERLRQLALRQKANQRDTEELARLNHDPNRIPAEKSSLLALAKVEQNALQKELRQLRESLGRLADHAGGAQELFREAQQVARDRGLERLPTEAVEKLDRNLHEAFHTQKRTHEALLAVMEALARKTPKEEQLQHLAAQLQDISRQQERLAQTVPKAGVEDQASLKKAQEQLSDQVEMVQEALKNLNGESAKQAEEIQKASEKIAEQLKEKNRLEKAAKAAEVADAQQDVAERLDELARHLMQEAGQIANASAAQPEKEAQALSDKLESLAQEQKKLAGQTANASAAEQPNLKQQQEQLAAQVDAARQAAEQLNPEAAQQTRKAAEQSNQAQQMLSEEGFLDKPENKPQLAQTQQDIAGQLQAASDALQQQAEALAEARANAPSPAEMADQAAALGETLEALASQQEQLAQAAAEATTPAQQAGLQKQQEALAEQIQAAQQAAKALNPQAAQQAGEAGATAKSAAKMLQQEGVLDNASQEAQLAGAQKKTAEQLQNAGEMLAAQADALASTQLDAQQAALAEAVHEVMNARSQMELARRQLEEGAPSGQVQERLGKSQGSLAQAGQITAGMDLPVSGKVGEALQKAQENLGETQESIGDSSAKNEAMESLAEAKQNADEALAGLQEAAQQLAAQKEALQGQALAQSQEQNRPQGASAQKNPQENRSDASERTGGFIDSRKAVSDYSAISKLSGGQRDALDLLKKEKVSPEYESQVQQYIRNLADGQVPTP